ncbi:MAG: TerB family tellurite resistance protein [Hyphomicrobiales bacterium]
MFDKIMDLFSKVSSEPEAEVAHFDEDDPRLSVAALLTHVMVVDGFIDPAERQALTKILKAEYDLDESEMDALINEAMAADKASVDFYNFTSRIKRQLDRDGILNIVEMLWQIVLADGVLHEIEDSVVWRIAELLGVETRERIRLRQKVEAKLASQ